MRVLLPFLFAASVFAAAPAAKDPSYDPRLGPPFAPRARASVGSDQAPIVVIEFASYKCAHCEAFHERSFPALQENYIKTGMVQWFLIATSDNPADESGRIFSIGRCVLRQGKFWDNLGFLMTIANKPPSFLNDLVRKNNAIDAGELEFCLQDRAIRQEVGKDFDEFRQMKVQGTPTFFVRKLRADGTRAEAIVRGYQGADYFQRIFDELSKTP